MPGERLDIMLHQQGLADSREKAKAFILAGRVQVNGQRADKPGQQVTETAVLTVTGSDNDYASRGGTKLAGAITAMNIDFDGKIVIDVGASTGGFTDCALRHGAVRVYAVDVGYGQLDWKIRQDPRVTVRERTNIRHVKPEEFPEKMNISVIDVSFISLTLVLPVVAELLDDHGEVIALVKPQFEAGREQVGKKGVVRDPAVHKEVLKKVTKAAGNLGLNLVNVCYSPIKGPNGNIEYFVYLKKEKGISSDILLDQIVNQAHKQL
ncbi:MAG: TlyA family RNA methyltransferase [Ignavibacteriales bacterium]